MDHLFGVGISVELIERYRVDILHSAQHFRAFVIYRTQVSIATAHVALILVLLK